MTSLVEKLNLKEKRDSNKTKFIATVASVNVIAFVILIIALYFGSKLTDADELLTDYWGSMMPDKIMTQENVVTNLTYIRNLLFFVFLLLVIIGNAAGTNLTNKDWQKSKKEYENLSDEAINK